MNKLCYNQWYNLRHELCTTYIKEGGIILEEDVRKLQAYILYHGTEYKLNMEEIGNLLGVSQSTISRWITEVEYKRQITDLTIQLDSAKANLEKSKIINPIRFVDKYDI